MAKQLPVKKKAKRRAKKKAKASSCAKRRENAVIHQKALALIDQSDDDLDLAVARGKIKASVQKSDLLQPTAQ